MNNITIGKNIEYYRKQSSMTLEEVGEVIGVSKQCLCSWEYGMNMPSAIALYRMAKIFKVNMEDFFTRE